MIQFQAVFESETDKTTTVCSVRRPSLVVFRFAKLLGTLRLLACHITHASLPLSHLLIFISHHSALNFQCHILGIFPFLFVSILSFTTAALRAVSQAPISTSVYTFTFHNHGCHFPLSLSSLILGFLRVYSSYKDSK